MCTRGDCVNYMGQWIRFQTPWGIHRGVVADVNRQAVLVRVPRRYVPMGLVNGVKTSEHVDDERRLDLALAAWGGGYGGYGYRAPYGAYKGRGWGNPGYGGWYGGWWWWWLAFAWIFWLAFLW